MKQDFIKAVESKNVAMVRIFLSNELLLDPRGTTFTEMLNFAKSKLDNLFEENEEANYTVPPQEDWDKEFLFKVKDDLDLNFSIEKLAFYQAVIEVVEKDKAQNIDKEEKETDKEKQLIPPSSDGHKSPKISQTAITITTGGAVLTILGLCLGKTLLTIAGGAVLVGGVLLIIKESNK